jgi:hypothetical protein
MRPEFAKSNDSKFQCNHAKPLQITEIGFAGLGNKPTPAITNESQKNYTKAKSASARRFSNDPEFRI